MNHLLPGGLPVIICKVGAILADEGIDYGRGTAEPKKRVSRGRSESMTENKGDIQREIDDVREEVEGEEGAMNQSPFFDRNSIFAPAVDPEYSIGGDVEEQSSFDEEMKR
jgi:hypothetical protein